MIIKEKHDGFGSGYINADNIDGDGDGDGIDNGYGDGFTYDNIYSHGCGSGAVLLFVAESD